MKVYSYFRLAIYMPHPSTNQFSGLPIEFSQALTPALNSLMHFLSVFSCFAGGQLHIGLCR